MVAKVFMTVGDLADELGVSLSTVRRLEKVGVVPQRDSSGRRLYNDRALELARLLVEHRRQSRSN